MRTRAAPKREIYRPTGTANWIIFVPLALLTFTVGLVMAGILHRVYLAGGYLVLVASTLASLPVAGMVCLTVLWGHCRRRAIAVIFALAAGLFCYLAFYYVGMVEEMGPEAAGRIDLLPRYIADRMMSDVQVDPSFPETERAPGDDKWFNWYMFLAELALTLLCTGLAAMACTRRAYCPQCRRWKKEEKVCLPADMGRRVLVSLGTGTLSETLQGAPPAAGGARSHTSVIVEYCPEGDSCPVYLSARESTFAGGSGNVHIDSRGLGRDVFRRLGLTPAEIEDLRCWFPNMAKSVRAGTDDGVLRREPAAGTPSERAQEPALLVVPVSDPNAARLTSGWIGFMASFRALLPILFAFAGIGVFFYGMFSLDPDADSAGVIMLRVVLMVAGVGLCFGMLLVNWSFLPGLYRFQRACDIFPGREGCLVSPGDPRAVFVDIVPREQLSKGTPEDCGFLLIDPDTRRMVIDGDRNRYFLPLDALHNIIVVNASDGVDGLHSYREYLVFRTATPGPAGEICVLPCPNGGPVGGSMGKRAQIRQMRELQSRIVSELTTAMAGEDQITGQENANLPAGEIVQEDGGLNGGTAR